MSGLLAPHERAGDPSQLSVHERHELVERRAIPFAYSLQ
jgi:hypothetical protein